MVSLMATQTHGEIDDQASVRWLPSTKISSRILLSHNLSTDTSSFFNKRKGTGSDKRRSVSQLVRCCPSINREEIMLDIRRYVFRGSMRSVKEIMRRERNYESAPMHHLF